MATEVYETAELTLLDGTKLTLKPLEIKRKRKFIKVMEKFRNTAEELKDEEGVTDSDIELAAYDRLIEATAICLSKVKPEYAEQDEDGSFSNLEDVLDDESMYKILHVCGGVDLKLNQEQMQELMKQLAAQELSGKS